jgi:Ni/Fe-hydrogenase subunit HybB-like protein
MAKILNMTEINVQIDKKTTMAKIKNDLLRPLTHHKNLSIWIGVLVIGLGLFIWGYTYQLMKGLSVTGMRDYVSWGMYISNFVFFIAVGLVGMLISAVLGILNIKWITPITRIAEIIALGFVMVAGLVIVVDMGRPDRLINVIIHGRIQSPIVWDITVITTYIAISLLLYLLPLLPDLGFMKKHMKNDVPKWQWKLYNILSFGWAGTPQQYKILHNAIRVLFVLIIPVALAIHTVTSWLFAATLRPGWDSTVFGPYFVSGAFVAGAAALIIAMYFYRKNFKLSEYLTDDLFDRMGKLLVLVSLIYAYFNLNEFLVPAYKMKTAEAEHLRSIFNGHFAWMFWFSQLVGLAIPVLLILWKKARKPLPLTIISIAVFLGAWFKRYLIVIPTLQHPHLPMQNVPQEFHHYSPTGLEITLTVGTFFLSIVIITILSKLFPVISIWETAYSKGVNLDKDI